MQRQRPLRTGYESILCEQPGVNPKAAAAAGVVTTSEIQSNTAFTGA